MSARLCALLKAAEDQPRDENGRWTSDGAGNLESLKTQDLVYGDDIYSTDVFAGLAQGEQHAVPEWAYVTETVDLATLFASQEAVSKEKVGRNFSGPRVGPDGKSTLPTAVRLPDGRTIVQDGHHRAYAAALLGSPRIAAKVLPFPSKKR